MSTTSELVQKYFDIWNERDADTRLAWMKAFLTEDSTYSDHDYEVLRGYDALTEAIGTAHGKFGDLTFTFDTVVAEHHDRALVSWKLGTVASGFNVVEFDGNRIRSVVGFVA
ncbi:nuclear transport factor 2 family protein [Actinomadura harenae]|uniref:Nuclear transport factor 2 family protein n=1 Tax=Actinomadura harenae TaxID=2483351 RepID=A0A3M2LTP9_9ACTN|nr:nuclear transport factor 2 family protein [Actinomadura harenae]RMI40602.1 nuclear transport factor 2 family protein [Actinomadura harenae]